MKKTALYLILFLAACNSEKKQDNAVKPAADSIPAMEKKMQDDIARYPDSMLLKKNLARYFKDNGDYESAIKVISQAIAKDSSSAELWDIQGTLHFLNEDTLASIRCYERAVDILPDPELVISLGTLYAQTGNLKALLMADGLLSADKAKAEKEAYFIKGLYFSKINEKQKAIGYFDKCLALNYTYMDAYVEKGMALYDMKKYEEALAVFDKAITVQNSFQPAYYYEGKCLEKLNRKEEAIQAYQNAVTLDPDDVEAKDALGKLGVN